MASLAVMAVLQVTPGACSGVPISGAGTGHLTGQVTSAAYLATGAARSEPSEARAVHGRHGVPGVQYGPGVVGAGCTRGASGARVRARCAHYTRVDECIYGLMLGQARAGTGPESVPELCNNSARTVPNSANNRHRHTRHRHTRHRHTQHPTHAMYPGYIVTRCRHNC